MRDIAMVAVAIAFFLVCVGYVSLCDRIIGPDDVDASVPRERETSGR